MPAGWHEKFETADGLAELYLGDCREILADVTADCLVCDPPYKLTSGGDTKSARALGGWIGNYGNHGAPVDCDIEWPEIMRLAAGLVPAGDIYLMANNRNIGPALAAAEAVPGLEFHNLLVWDKCAPVVNRWYMKNLEFTAYLYTGAARTINNVESQQLIKVPAGKNHSHPTQKPVELMRHYIENSTAPADLVCDPFAGSGTTGVAALQCGRRFIGCEIDKAHFDNAAGRLLAAKNQIGLFESAPGHLVQGAII